MEVDGGGLHKRKEDDLFVTPRDLNGALHGDIVLAKKKELAARSKDLPARTSAVVFKIVKRGFINVVGTYEKLKGFGFVKPDEKKLSHDIFVKTENSKNAQSGEKVVVNIINYNNDRGKVEGRVTEILGMPGFKGVDVLSVIRAKNLFEEFSPECLRVANQMPTSVEIAKYPKRKVFQDCGIMTIDGEDARDFDDAIHITKEGKNTRLFVHIADVCEYVTHNSVIDQQALMRGTSVYFPDRVLHMIPPKLSTGICSLNPNVFRLTITAEMLFDENGTAIDGKIYESIIKSQARMTYTKVTKILDEDKELCIKHSDIVTSINTMAELAVKIEKMRVKRGAIEFDMPEAYIIVDENGKTTDIVKRPREVSHRIIETFMVAANEFVAEKFFTYGKPFIYRVHEKPDPLRVANFFEFTSGFGEVFDLKGELTNKELQRFLKQLEGKPYEGTINKLALRTMQKARYHENCLGHYGLASVYYCHFTSPIRRYPDLAIHRVIKSYLRGELTEGSAKLTEFLEFVPFAAAQSSHREKLAEEAERDVDDMKKAEYMERFVGEEFDGVISGVQPFGVFVELENTCEGLIRLEHLEKGTYEYLEKRIMLKGPGKTYRLGDLIRVRVISASPQEKRIDFAEAPMLSKVMKE